MRLRPVDRNGHVQFHEDRGRAGGHAKNASPEANRKARRRCGRRGVPGFGHGALDHRGQYPGRRRVKALENRVSCMGHNAESNKALVLTAFDTLFNKRGYVTAEKFWSPRYIQHSAHIPPGRDALFDLVRGLPQTLKYEPGTIVAEGDFVIVHGRFSSFGLPVDWIAADILRIEDGILVEHWDVIQDEAARESSKSGLPMFGNEFPK